MPSAMLWNRLKTFAQRRSVHPLNDMWSAEEFGVILDGELARAHRHGYEFSLLVFDSTGTEHFENLGSVLCQRVRSTDDVGWLDERRIAVILPDTSIHGAWKVADDIREQMAALGSSPDCVVYTYPSQWFSECNTVSQQSSN